jgi:hypothetical protein
MCKRHATLEAKRARTDALILMWADAFNVLWERIVPAAEWMTYVGDRLDAMNATERERDEAAFIAEGELEVFRRFNPPVGDEPGAPRTELEALSLDAQNVHTPAVNAQTQAGVDVLVDTPSVVGQDTLAEIHAVWKAHPRAARASVLKDMGYCYTTADTLYQRVLDGLWTRIKVSPHKSDLVQRLWEEALESKGMCFQGHISRLCNVLVGYDETVKAPVSTGELLQQAMAAIADEDISLPHKVIKAWEAMDELQIPREQRMEWIEAF